MRGARLPAIALIALGIMLSGCAGPMGQREATARANRSLSEFCRAKPCGALRMLKAQKLKDRWMVDYDAPGALYTVAVNRSGATDVSVWTKNQAR